MISFRHYTKAAKYLLEVNPDSIISGISMQRNGEWGGIIGTIGYNGKKQHHQYLRRILLLK